MPRSGSPNPEPRPAVVPRSSRPKSVSHPATTISLVVIGTTRRAERRSVCAEPRDDSPATVHLCFLGTEGVNVQQEIVETAQKVVGRLRLSRIAAMQREAIIVGEIRGRMRAMARGRLPEEDPPALEPVVSQPDLFELRWKFIKEKALVRAYHGEPRDPDVVVVRVHCKRTDAPVDEQQALQNAEMAEGQRRFTAGERSRWGHTRACSHCLPS